MLYIIHVRSILICSEEMLTQSEFIKKISPVTSNLFIVVLLPGY